MSCNANNTENKTFEKSKVTMMQKLMAEKAVKMPTEGNPVVAHKYGADPAVLVYGDTLYLYTTNDMQQFDFTQGRKDNGYDKINTLNVFSTKDLVNWTDCGEIAVAGRNNPNGAAKWANNSWAPAVCWKNINGKDKFFIYFADSGNGIGVISGDSPVGPFEDPINAPLISRQTPTCAKINWLFDPAVMVDADGKGYLYFGGGHDPETYEHPKNARCVALADDMVSIIGEPQMIDAPFLFEDSGINRIGDTYYYTYCTNWMDRSKSNDPDKMPIAVIGYMTSKNPLGPFEYKGYTLENPATYFGPGGNNHHWIFNFKNKWYIAYHTQTMEKTVGAEKGGYRNIFIDNFEVNADGSLPIQKGTKAGVAQVAAFNPYERVPAATIAFSKNVAVTTSQALRTFEKDGYVCIKGVDFTNGAKKVVLEHVAGEGSVKFSLDKMGDSGVSLGEVKLGKGCVTEGKLKMADDLKGTHDLYISISQGVELISWKFEGVYA